MNYTRNHKMNIFSNRVAPIQINYLGLEASTGSNEIDYLIADEITVPKKYANYYSETILYMPNCYMPFNNQRRISEKIFSRSNFDLPLSFVSFRLTKVIGICLPSCAVAFILSTKSLLNSSSEEVISTCPLAILAIKITHK